MAFFIQLLNKTALQEIGARETVIIGNPPLDSPTEEEVANDMIRVDVRHLLLPLPLPLLIQETHKRTSKDTQMKKKYF